MDAASVFHDTLNKVVNPPKPDTLMSSVPEVKSELPILHFREVQHPQNPVGGSPAKSWLVILKDEYGLATDQIEESVVEDRLVLEQRFRRLWSDLLQNRSHAHLHEMKKRDEEVDDDEMKVTVEEPALPVKEDLETTMHIASETFKMLQNAEVSVEYRGVKVTLRR